MHKDPILTLRLITKLFTVEGTASGALPVVLLVATAIGVALSLH